MWVFKYILICSLYGYIIVWMSFFSQFPRLKNIFSSKNTRNDSERPIPRIKNAKVRSNSVNIRVLVSGGLSVLHSLVTGK